MEEIKTLDELKEDWGLERYVKAYGIMTGFILSNPHPVLVEKLQELDNTSSDAFELFCVRTYHSVGLE